ncbi:MAG: hypothetical protein AAAC47_01495 [Pararhizobium sp.]
MFASLLITAALVSAAFLIFHATALREAAHLHGKFADACGAKPLTHHFLAEFPSVQERNGSHLLNDRAHDNVS